MFGIFRSCTRRALASLTMLAILLQPALGGGSRRLLKAAGSTVSGTAVVIAEEREGGRHARVLAVQIASGTHVQVQVADSQQLQGLHTGMAIQATGTWQQQGNSVQAASANPSSSTAVLQAASVVVSSRLDDRSALAVSPSDLVSAAASTTAPVARIANKPITRSLNAVFIPVAAVNSRGAACPGMELPKLGTADIKKAVFAESNPTNPTVGSTFNKCSFGTTRLNTSNSIVTELVTLPCDGTTDGMSWTFSKCEYNDYHGYAAAANAKLREQGFPLDSYKHRVYLLPPGACPGVEARGTLGCGSECRVWISAANWLEPNAIVHELLHNQFLAHAGAWVPEDEYYDDYGDDADTMGGCCSNRCPNTAHAWQLGWLNVQQLDGSSLAPGRTVTLNLASQALTANSGLRIVPTWAAGVVPVFVGFRTRAGGDAQLSPAFAGKLTVHSANITGPYDLVPTKREAVLSAGQSWRHPSTGLVVRALRFSKGSSASISVCRVGGAETAATCAARTDNDCNGLVGQADPACQQVKRKTQKG